MPFTHLCPLVCPPCTKKGLTSSCCVSVEFFLYPYFVLKCILPSYLFVPEVVECIGYYSTDIVCFPIFCCILFVGKLFCLLFWFIGS